jgi:molecular chaperone DnaK
MQTEINLPFITANAEGPKHLQTNLTRARFEQLTQNLLERIKEPVNRVLQDAKFNPDQLDEIVLVGGSTRMPMVQELVRKMTGKVPNKSVNPDEVVALGAALQGGVLGGEVNDVLLLDVTPLSLGLETLGGVMTTLIARNTTIPSRKTEVFSTAEDSQMAVDIQVLQGERPMAADNNSLGVFRLDGIPAAPRGIPQIEVTFDIDANGILNVSAKDKATGKSQAITITASTNLNDGDIDRMVREADQNAAQDQQRRESIEVRNMADQLIYQTEKSLQNLNGQAPAEVRQQVESKVGELKEALNGEDIEQIKQISGELQQVSMSLGEAMYQGQSESSANGSSNDSGGTVEEDFIEGEFETA